VSPRVSRPELLPASAARRLLLSGQGLLTDPAGPATEARVAALVEQLGYVQVDSINVVARAHHLTLWSRLDGYRPALLTRLLEHRRRLFEHWTHDASVISTRWYAHWHHRFARDAERVRGSAWWRERLGARPQATLEALLERVAREGPLGTADLEGPRVPGGWWAWTPEKAALEYLWRTGKLLVARRDNFQKVYDLAERVLPEVAKAPASTPAEHLEWAMRTALERLGAGTPTELAHFLGAVGPAEARAWCAAGLARGALVAVALEAADGSAPAVGVAAPGWREAARALPPAPARTRLLSPFDPVVRDRRRARRLFGFDFRFEAFTPAAKRQHGYYVLPVLEGERLLARVDLKHRREAGELALQGQWWEPGVAATRRRRAGLDEALERLAGQLGAGRVAAPRAPARGNKPASPLP
jgi:uncharacterized protein YcaQ